MKDTFLGFFLQISDVQSCATSSSYKLSNKKKNIGKWDTEQIFKPCYVTLPTKK